MTQFHSQNSAFAEIKEHSGFLNSIHMFWFLWVLFVVDGEEYLGVHLGLFLYFLMHMDELVSEGNFSKLKEGSTKTDLILA